MIEERMKIMRRAKFNIRIMMAREFDWVMRNFKR